MLEYRDPRVVLILNAAGIPQGDNERELVEQVLHEFGRLVSAISNMTPPIRRVLSHGLIRELRAFSQAQSLDIPGIVRTPTPEQNPPQEDEVQLDMRIWREFIDGLGNASE